jgi:hypothetical protein
MYLFIYLFIYLLIYLAIYLFIYLFILLSYLLFFISYVICWYEYVCYYSADHGWRGWCILRLYLAPPSLRAARSLLFSSLNCHTFLVHKGFFSDPEKPKPGAKPALLTYEQEIESANQLSVHEPIEKLWLVAHLTILLAFCFWFCR